VVAGEGLVGEVGGGRVVFGKVTTTFWVVNGHFQVGS
jgi:hypothetical protein